MTEQVKLSGVGKFVHTVFDGFYEVGKTIYNWRNRQRPIIKDGRASSEVLNMARMWFSLEQAEKDLLSIGFKKNKNGEWWR